MGVCNSACFSESVAMWTQVKDDFIVIWKGAKLYVHQLAQFIHCLYILAGLAERRVVWLLLFDLHSYEICSASFSAFNPPLCLTVALAAKRTLHYAVQCHQTNMLRKLKGLPRSCIHFPLVLWERVVIRKHTDCPNKADKIQRKQVSCHKLTHS